MQFVPFHLVTVILLLVINESSATAKSQAVPEISFMTNLNQQNAPTSTKDVLQTNQDRNAAIGGAVVNYPPAPKKNPIVSTTEDRNALIGGAAVSVNLSLQKKTPTVLDVEERYAPIGGAAVPYNPLVQTGGEMVVNSEYEGKGLFQRIAQLFDVGGEEKPTRRLREQ
ncbi:unnamed protein product [Peronospora belbahrii]|uniref:Uncharacterized protein n=1 Tax=Peronospora belbahrii TaxID=622444 RepID=A0ABN8D2U9_9STRA|nr:unnamed protein product [Peronospora belbahrii]